VFRTELLLETVPATVDSWYQTLTFSLNNSPAGTAIDPATGVLNWAATNVVAPSTNIITVRVTDNGTPPLSDAKIFSVIVQPPLQFGSITPNGNAINFTFNSLPGQSYQLEYKNNLGDPQWPLLDPAVAGTGNALVLTDNAPPAAQRFYQLAVEYSNE
jgi:hypothetical protein